MQMKASLQSPGSFHRIAWRSTTFSYVDVSCIFALLPRCSTGFKHHFCQDWESLLPILYLSHTEPSMRSSLQALSCKSNRNLEIAVGTPVGTTPASRAAALTMLTEAIAKATNPEAGKRRRVSRRVRKAFLFFLGDETNAWAKGDWKLGTDWFLASNAVLQGCGLFIYSLHHGTKASDK